MPDKSQIGDRMKDLEHSSRVFLEKKVPVIIRIDGKAFHTYTKGCLKPFDNALINAMDFTARQLLKEIQNSVMTYVQSDEISIVMDDSRKDVTDPWFGNNLQKICSVSASIATAVFNSTSFARNHGGLALFDARAWNHQKEDIGNYFYWRFLDARRNAISMIASSCYSHKQLDGKTTADRKAMLSAFHDYDYDFTMRQKFGGLYIKESDENLISEDAKYHFFQEIFTKEKQND